LAPAPPRPLLRARPFLKWAGGKARLATVYDTLGLLHAPSRGTYFEPFLGGGAVFFHLAPRKAHLVDANKELVNTYKVVQKQVEGLIEALGEHVAAHARDPKGHYYEVRAQRPTKLRMVERAARLLYLNKTCFNGLYRVNRDGQFNVPMGRYSRPNILDEEALRAASAALAGARIQHGDFRAVEEKAKPGDFAYFDPPYDPLTPTSNFTSYTSAEFGREEQRELAALVNRLAAKGVACVVSNSDTRYIRELYAHWWVTPVKATRAINSRTDRRHPVGEVVVSTFPPARR
ncbi:MAG TPA: Dam family site-specific DNA-(adenine-N6)-methyltransferase, partial [Candidatus Thermoplasmatota archaeon]|nr:Dam family site-specific DNA-(adenine-N6)-methyltransferase [Candidatus Thermoplasmatota archaeon]